MNNKLAHLVIDYQEKVKTALILMKRSGIRMPSSMMDWVTADIPYKGVLDGGIKYFKHGTGCLVSLDTGEVDFDFGEYGEIGGFNAWWLTRFAKNRLADYDFDNEDEVYEYLEEALSTGKLVCSHNGLYFVANVPRMFAVDIDCRLSGDMLPDQNCDRVFTLQSHYFQTAVVMFEHYEKLRKKMNKTNHLSRRESVDERIYFCTWLGFLGVTCEGFRQLNMRLLLEKERPESFKELIPISDDLGKIMKIHSDSLRMFRNNIFHLRENSDVMRQFILDDADRIPWAKELHISFDRFFSKYRVMCEVHYIAHGRKGESDLITRRTYRKRSLP